MDYMNLLEKIGERYQKICKNNLVGIYVHGSIAFGCYNAKKSDIDFLVVVEKEPSLEEKEKLIETLLELDTLAPEKGYEMSVVLKNVCETFVYPTPFVLHYSNLHRERCRKDLTSYCKTMNGTDPDLAAHFTVIRQVGYALVGLPVCEVFGEVPKEDFIDSITKDIKDAMEEVKENPIYIILNLCRVLGYIAEHKVLSKEQGGVWGLQHIPEKYHSIVQTALEEYQSEGENTLIQQFDEKHLIAFCSYMNRCIFKTEY